MNTSLFRSRHAFVAAALVLGLLLLAFGLGTPFGRSPRSERSFLLLTGIVALALLAVVFAYVLRKYAHRGGYSPEFRLRVDYAALERAEQRIRGLRQRVNAGHLGSARDIVAEGRSILRREGVHRVCDLEVEPGTAATDPFVLRVVPTEPLGRVARWMHAHAYYGAAFGLLVLMHGGFVPRSGFGWMLALSSYTVTATGLVGIVLWATGPRRLTKRERDLTLEEARALSRSLRAKRDAALEEFEPEVRSGLSRLLEVPATPARVREILALQVERFPDRRRELESWTALASQEATVRAEWNALRRVHGSFTSWKFLHVPSALFLAVLLLVHLLSVWRY